MASGPIRAEITLPADAVIVRAEPRWISRANVEAVVGRSWRWLLDQLPALRAAGVPISGSRKAPMVCAAGLDAYLRTQAAAQLQRVAAPANDGDEGDEIDQILARGGTKRIRRAGR